MCESPQFRIHAIPHMLMLTHSCCTCTSATTAAEEARWKAELRDREAARMASLEGEWRRREAQREAEAAALRAEYATLEDRARKVSVWQLEGGR